MYCFVSGSNDQKNYTKSRLSAYDNVLVAASIVEKDVRAEAPPVLTLPPAGGMDPKEEEDTAPVPDFKAKTYITKLPFHCDFGKTVLPVKHCGFSNAENDDFDWIANVYDTPTARTGPPVVRFEQQCKKTYDHSAIYHTSYTIPHVYNYVFLLYLYFSYGKPIPHPCTKMLFLNCLFIR